MSALPGMEWALGFPTEDWRVAGDGRLWAMGRNEVRSARATIFDLIEDEGPLLTLFLSEAGRIAGLSALEVLDAVSSGDPAGRTALAEAAGRATWLDGIEGETARAALTAAVLEAVGRAAAAPSGGPRTGPAGLGDEDDV